MCPSASNDSTYFLSSSILAGSSGYSFLLGGSADSSFLSILCSKLILIFGRYTGYFGSSNTCGKRVSRSLNVSFATSASTPCVSPSPYVPKEALCVKCNYGTSFYYNRIKFDHLYCFVLKPWLNVLKDTVSTSQCVGRNAYVCLATANFLWWG